MSYYISDKNNCFVFSASDLEYTMKISKYDFEKMCIKHALPFDFKDAMHELNTNDVFEFEYNDITYKLTWVS